MELFQTLWQWVLSFETVAWLASVAMNLIGKIGFAEAPIQLIFSPVSDFVKEDKESEYGPGDRIYENKKYYFNIENTSSFVTIKDVRCEIEYVKPLPDEFGEASPVKLLRMVKLRFADLDNASMVNLNPRNREKVWFIEWGYLPLIHVPIHVLQTENEWIQSFAKKYQVVLRLSFKNFQPVFYACVIYTPNEKTLIIEQFKRKTVKSQSTKEAALA